jgi:hypothetical protein
MTNIQINSSNLSWKWERSEKYFEKSSIYCRVPSCGPRCSVMALFEGRIDLEEDSVLLWECGCSRGHPILEGS